MLKGKPFRPPGLYAITDTQLCALPHAEQVGKLIQGGATLIQLREKHRPSGGFYEDAEAAVRVARARGVRVIINDRVDIALALQADGVHLGQQDLSPVVARQILGPDAIIGLSTHNQEQAEPEQHSPERSPDRMTLHIAAHLVTPSTSWPGGH